MGNHTISFKFSHTYKFSKIIIFQKFRLCKKKFKTRYSSNCSSHSRTVTPGLLHFSCLLQIFEKIGLKTLLTRIYSRTITLFWHFLYQSCNTIMCCRSRFASKIICKCGHIESSDKKYDIFQICQLYYTHLKL